MLNNWKKLAVCLAIPLGAGGLAGALSAGGMKQFQGLNQPPLSPPRWVFPVVWTILYLLMGYASYRILILEALPGEKRRALTAYLAQIAANFLWPILFFGMEWYLVAFLELLVLWTLVFVTMVRFYPMDSVAGDLLLPYLLWVTFAAYLNFGVYRLNGVASGGFF